MSLKKSLINKSDNPKKTGQALLEYTLLVAMIMLTIGVLFNSFVLKLSQDDSGALESHFRVVSSYITGIVPSE